MIVNKLDLKEYSEWKRLIFSDEIKRAPTIKVSALSYLCIKLTFCF